jgi:hypothetical protein
MLGMRLREWTTQYSPVSMNPIWGKRHPSSWTNCSWCAKSQSETTFIGHPYPLPAKTLLSGSKFDMSQFRMPLLRLYRTILKQHNKKLPYEMKKLGDDYVRSEFRSIKKAKKDEQVKMCVFLPYIRIFSAARTTDYCIS